MQNLKQKQNYLRDNIPQERYEQFYEYLIDTVGNFDIDKWSKEFIIEIVSNYLREHPVQDNALETSFYLYQQLENKSPVNKEPEIIKTKPKSLPKTSEKDTKQAEGKKNIGQPLHNNKQKVPQSIKYGNNLNGEIPSKLIAQKNGPGQDKNKPQNSEKKVSAISFVDNFFSQIQNDVGHGKSISQKNQRNIPVNDFLTIVPTASQKVAYDFSILDNREFWSSSAPNKVNKQKDYLNFDFSITPNTSRSQTQANFSLTEPKNPTESSMSLPETNNKPAQPFIPSFDNLILNMNPNKQKTPSPYLKKDFVQQKTVSNNNPIIKIKKVPYGGISILKTEFKDNVKCFQSCYRSKLKGDDVLVVMQGHEIINRSFLMPDYVMYSIRVLPMNITIKRNYEDFAHLKQNLSEFYPGIQLPYLEKSSWFNSTNLENVKKQKNMIEQFLNDLIGNEQIRHSKLMQDFLIVQEHKKIKRKFEQYEKLEKPKSIQELCLLKGSVDINISQNQRIYQENVKDYHEKMVQYLQRHERLNSALYKQYEQVSNTLNALSELCKAISTQTQKFNQKVYSFQIENIQKTFKEIEICYKQQSKYTKFQIQIINNRVLPFLTYEKWNLAELYQIINLQQSFFKSYLKRNQSEKVDPNIPYTSDKIKQYKIGILEQSKNFTVFKYQTGYLSNQLCNETKRVFESIGTRYHHLWKRIQQRVSDQLSTKLQFWKKTSNNKDSILR